MQSNTDIQIHGNRISVTDWSFVTVAYPDEVGDGNGYGLIPEVFWSEQMLEDLSIDGEDNVKIDLKIGIGAWTGDKWRALVNPVKNLRLPWWEGGWGGVFWPAEDLLHF